MGEDRKGNQLSRRQPPPLPDSRPQVREADGIHLIAGYACSQCGHPLAVAGAWCPECQSDIEPKKFGPLGTVWSSTVFRVPLPDRTPPWVLAWVDLDGGPRILAHVEGDAERVAIGSRVELVGETVQGDPLVRQLKTESAGVTS